MVTPHSYATCGYAGYATVTPDKVTPHGYATCGHVGYATVTPNTVTSHGYTTRTGGEKLCKNMKNFVSLTF